MGTIEDGPTGLNITSVGGGAGWGGSDEGGGNGEGGGSGEGGDSVPSAVGGSGLGGTGGATKQLSGVVLPTVMMLVTISKLESAEAPHVISISMNVSLKHHTVTYPVGDSPDRTTRRKRAAVGVQDAPVLRRSA